MSSSYSPNVIVRQVHESRGNSDGRKKKEMDVCVWGGGGGGSPIINELRISQN